MWFRRRNMGYAKRLKDQKYGHMKVQVQKNDEHMEAHVLTKKRRKKEKEKDSHVSKH